MQARYLLESPALNCACPQHPGEAVAGMALGTDERPGERSSFDQNSEENMTLEKLQSGLWEAVGEARICASVGLPENTAAASTVTEHSNSWGDFEGFTESVAKSESFNNMLEALVPVSDSLQNVAAVNQTHCTTSGHDYPESTEHDRRNAAADSGAEVSLSYEDIFKFSFPDGPVQQSPEIVISLNRLLETSSEEKGGVELVEAQLGVNSVSTWRTIHGMSTGSGLRCSWHEFTCCKNIMFALGINADQKNVSGGADHFVVGTNLDAEETEVDGLGLNGSRALIQTKLSVSPDSKHGRIFTYQLFLKKQPSDRNAPSLTFPGRKDIFAAQDLKMKT